MNRFIKGMMAAAVGAGVMSALAGGESKTVGWAIVDAAATEAPAAPVRQLLAVSFKGFDGNDVKVDDFLDKDQLVGGEKLYAYDTANAVYNGWSFDGTEKTWKPLKKLVKDANGRYAADESKDTTETVLKTGSAVWLERTGEAATKQVVLTGATAAVEAASLLEGWNLMSVSSIEPDVTDLESLFPSAGEGDVILVPQTGKAPERFTKKSGTWGHYVETVTSDGKGHSIKDVSWSTEVTLTAGVGFWFVKANEE